MSFNSQSKHTSFFFKLPPNNYICIALMSCNPNSCSSKLSAIGNMTNSFPARIFFFFCTGAGGCVCWHLLSRFLGTELVTQSVSLLGRCEEILLPGAHWEALHPPKRSRWRWCSLLRGSETFAHLQGRGKLCLEQNHRDHLSHIFLLFLPNKNIKKIPRDLSHRERVETENENPSWQPKGFRWILVIRDLSFLVP